MLLLQATPTPSQFTLESKFLHGQPMYRFPLASEGEFIVDLRPGHLCLMSLTNGNMWNIRRRPLMHPVMLYVLITVFLLLFDHLLARHNKAVYGVRQFTRRFFQFECNL